VKPTPIKTYNFSITKGSIYFRETKAIVETYVQIKDWEGVFESVKEHEVFRGVKLPTFKTKFPLIKNRIETLPVDLIEQDFDDDEWLLVFYIACCEYHEYLKDLVLDLIYEKYLILQPQLTEDDYRSFLFNKMDEQPELEAVTTNTLYKIRQVVMLILADAGVLDSTKSWRIQKPYTSDYLASKLKEHNKLYLKYLLWTDYEINQL